MKALTLWQPWASLVAHGYKTVEYRGWPAPRSIVGTRIAIHAAARRPRMREVKPLTYEVMSDDARRISEAFGFDMPAIRTMCATTSLDDYPRRCILATALLAESLPPDRVAERTGRDLASMSLDEIMLYSHAWRLEDVRMLPEPLFCTGAQGFWNAPEGVLGLLP